jgi:transcriptional regulator with XRE-family HTH domain
MKVAAVGAIVRSYRKASGVSQKELAGMVGISRATLNYLESGRDLEIGASKLLSLLTVLGVPFVMPAEVDRAADEAVIDRACKQLAGKGRKKLPRRVVIEAFTSGRVPIGLEKEFAAFLEEAPDPAVLSVVRATSSVDGPNAAAVWRNARALAKAAGCSRKVWLRGD